MPRAEKGSLKDLDKRQKMRGLQKLVFYCQMCEKQCRDENGFKCHCASEGHQRQMGLFAQNPERFMDTFSRDFEAAFLDLLSRRFGARRVMGNLVYNEYIQDKEHVHMNSTMWPTLTDFIKYLGRTGKAEIEETERGWYVTFINKDPEALRRAEIAAARRESENAAGARYEDEVDALAAAAAVGAGAGAGGAGGSGSDHALVSAGGGGLLASAGGGSLLGGLGAARQRLVGLAARGALGGGEDNDDDDEGMGGGAGGSGGSADRGGGVPEAAAPAVAGGDSRSKKRSRWDGGAEEAAPAPPPPLPHNPQHGGYPSSAASNMASLIAEERAAKAARTEVRRDSAPPLGGVYVPRGSAPPPQAPPPLTATVAAIPTNGRRPGWLLPDIIVRVMNSVVGGGKYLNGRARVDAVEGAGTVGRVVMLEGGDVLRVDAAELETVVPRVGGTCCILNGPHRGRLGEVAALHPEAFSADVQLLSEEEEPTVGGGAPREPLLRGLEYEDFSRI